MACWPLAVRNFKEIYPYIDDSEKKNIPEVLWIEIPNEYEKYYGHKLPPIQKLMTGNQPNNQQSKGNED